MAQNTMPKSSQKGTQRLGDQTVSLGKAVMGRSVSPGFDEFSSGTFLELEGMLKVLGCKEA